MKKHVWELSAKNSSIHFKVKYLQISNISGQFLKFSGRVIAGDLFNDPEVSISIESNSVETLDTRRNMELRSDALLDVGKYPYLSFNSIGGCQQSVGKIWELTGDLVIKEIKKPITLIINFSYVKEDVKRPTALFHLFGKISRNTFGLHCADGPDTDDEVQLNAEIFMIRKG